MTSLLNDLPETLTPSAEDAQLIQEPSRQLAKILAAKKDSVQVRIQAAGRKEETIAIPLVFCQP